MTIPPYRGDIMHQTDLIEEVAIMYGYESFEPIEPRIPTIGRTDPLGDFSDTLRELMLGLGFQEIMTFVLTSPENVSVRMGNRDVPYVEIENPSTATHSIFRPDLVPSIMEFLGHNAHVSYPQKIFELGESVTLDERGCTTEKRLCLAWADSKVNLTQLKGLVDSIMETFDLEYTERPLEASPFIPGRAAMVEVGGSPAGTYGEIHPRVLESWQIPVPVLVAELRVDPIFRFLS